MIGIVFGAGFKDSENLSEILKNDNIGNNKNIQNDQTIAEEWGR